MDNTINAIETIIRNLLQKNKKKFVIYPLGKQGIITKNILNNKYGIEEEFIIDNDLCKINKKIKSVSYIQEINTKGLTFLLTSSMNTSVYNSIKNYIKDENIVNYSNLIREQSHTHTHTRIGRFCYGPLSFPHHYVEEVGSFCSFAPGVDVVGSHLLNAISTHGILYSPYFMDILDNSKGREYLAKEKVRIGNDVWLGRDVLITKGVRIGNGVVAGAKSVITKDIPDYAIVAGVPARIIRFRFQQEQINKLNAIKWWDWDIEKIKENYNLFFNIEEFIEKNYKQEK